MKLDGLHHISCITADATKNLDFYTRVLGLRLLAKSVNQDDPSAYHLFYGDEHAKPGADLTFFEYPGASPGRAGAGMVHRIVLRVGSVEALAFWKPRLEAEGVATTVEGDRLRFTAPEGLDFELVVPVAPDAPLIADHPEIPREHALQGFDSVRAYARRPERSRDVFETVLGAQPAGETAWEFRARTRGSTFTWDPPPAQHGLPGAGTVHHVAWGTTQAEHPKWLAHLNEAGVPNSGIIDRFYFHSIYFREPNGVLFELADDGPGFTVDTPESELGRRIVLPPFLESQRAAIEAHLTPLPDPRASWGKTRA